MLWMLLPAGIFAADEKIKKKAESWEEKEPPRKMFGGRIILQKLHNQGAALSFMRQTPKVLTFVTTAVTAGITLSYVRLKADGGNLLLKSGTGMILGGAWSNVWDRIHRGYVVDYFSFRSKYEEIQNIVFNLSDMFIFFGGILVIFWNMLRKS